MKGIVSALFFLLFGSLLHADPPTYFTEITWERKDYPIDPGHFRDRLYDRGIAILPDTVFDPIWPARGGVKNPSHPIYQWLFELNVGIDTQKLFSWKGGYLFSCFQVHTGGIPSQKYTGDYQYFDDLEGPDFAWWTELWYYQSFCRNQLSVMFGKIDMAPIIAYTAYSQTLINNSFSQMPTILGFPSYPNPSCGIVLRFSRLKIGDIHLSLFDGSNASGVNTGGMGPKGFFDRLGSHALLMGQYAVKWKENSLCFPGYCQVGFWGLTGNLSTVSGGKSKGAVGPYFVINQSLYTKKKSPFEKHVLNIGCFGQFGCTNQQTAEGYCYLGAGVTGNHLWKKFSSDSLSLGLANIFFSRAEGGKRPHPFEMALEATYQVFVTNYFFVQPDCQYIIHPSGAKYRNDLVFILRFGGNI